MRRYGVRFLVAVLTFGLGVALSFVLGAVGLFGAQRQKNSHHWVVAIVRRSQNSGFGTYSLGITCNQNA